MSEPTGDGKDQPDPAEDQVQDQGSDFGDPTAPIWVDPTAPVPPPLAPPGAASPYGQQSAAAPQAVPQPTPPVNNPYAQQPPAPPYGQQPPAYSQQYYATGAPAVPSNTSAIILTIVSGLSMVGSAFFVGIPSLIFGILALTSNNTDPAGSRKKARIGWIIYAINAGAVVLLVIVAIVALIGFGGGGSANFNTGY